MKRKRNCEFLFFFRWHCLSRIYGTGGVHQIDLSSSSCSWPSLLTAPYSRVSVSAFTCLNSSSSESISEGVSHSRVSPFEEHLFFYASQRGLTLRFFRNLIAIPCRFMQKCSSLTAMLESQGTAQGHIMDVSPVRSHPMLVIFSQ